MKSSFLPLTPECQSDWPEITPTMVNHLVDLAASRIFYPHHEATEVKCDECRSAVVEVAEEFSAWADLNINPQGCSGDEIFMALGKKLYRDLGSTDDEYSSNYLLFGRFFYACHLVAEWLEKTSRITDRDAADYWITYSIVDTFKDDMLIRAHNFN